MVEHSDAWYDYNRNDPNAKNPFVDPRDRERAERVVSGTSKMSVDTEKYLDFVAGVTSPASSNFAELLRRLSELEAEADCDTPHLLTAAFGLCAESGEFTEVL